MSLIVSLKPESKKEWDRSFSYPIRDPIELRADGYFEKEIPALPIKILSAPTCHDPDFFLFLASFNPPFLDIPHILGKAFFFKIKTQFPQIQLIVSYHNERETPDNLGEILSELKSFDAAVIKMATHAKSGLDGLRMLSLLQKESAQSKLSLFCMGPKGVFTRVLQPVFGGVWSYCYFDKATAPGQLSLKTMRQNYGFDHLNCETKRYGLIGKPLDQSPSDTTHSRLFRHFGINGVYVKIEIGKEEIDEALPYLINLDFSGLSITRPLKLCFDKDVPYNSAAIQDGKVSFFNTDGSAAIDAIEEKIPLQGKKMLLIGSGGVACAIAQEAKKRGADIYIKSNTVHRAETLGFKKYEKELRYQIVCNCRHDEPEGEILPQELAVDVRLENSIFLEKCRQKNLKIVDGLTLWKQQAAQQFLFWLGPYTICNLPPSKSQNMRAILFASLADGKSTIVNSLVSPDTDAMIEACRSLGATITQKGKTLLIEGIGKKRKLAKTTIDAKNSGIVLRFVAAVAALFSESVTIDGDESMKERRSCKELESCLKQLGAQVCSHEGHVPLSIQGPMKRGSVTIDGKDSQPVSGALIAMSLLEGESKLILKTCGERPWLNLTIEWLKRVGVTIHERAENTFSVTGCSSFAPFSYQVCPDCASAAYLVVAALLSKSTLLAFGLNFQEEQPDKKIFDLLRQMGAHFFIHDRFIYVHGPQKLQGGTFDCSDCIDMVTLLAVCGLFASGKSIICGASNARDKESNRLQAITKELKKMGANIEETADGLIVEPSMPHGGAVLQSHNDHRIAMSLQVAAHIARLDVEIQGKECVAKSFPNFFTELAKL